MSTQKREARDEFGYSLRPSSQRQIRNLLVHSSKNILLTFVSVMMTFVGLFFWLKRWGRSFPPLHPQSFHPRRILVIRLDLIGDLVMSLTAVRALKQTYPDADIDLLATPGSAKIIGSDPDLAQVIAYDPNIWRRPKALFQRRHWLDLWALRDRLHARQYDLAVNLHGNWGGLLGTLSGAPRLIGFRRENYWGLLTDPVAGKHWARGDHLHEVDYCLKLAEKAGANPIALDRTPHLQVEPEALVEVEHMLTEAGWQSNQPLIACHIASHNGQSKRWPIPYWATLIDRLIRDQHAAVVLTGAPGDLPFVEELLRKSRQQPINFAGKTSLKQLAALLARADLVLTGDSGPMHIAAAVGGRVVAFHGPTDPELSGPISPIATVLRSGIWCSPCYTAKGPADCRFFTTQCMKDLTPQIVYHKIQELLQEPISR